MSLMVNSWGSAAQPLIIAHRGASSECPENTLAAFHLAADQGADAIELDVQLSADQRLIIFHDLTLARLTGQRQRVSQMTLAELKEIDVGHGQTIPTLDELLEMMGPRLLYDVELKDFSLRDKGLEAAVADRFESFGLEDKLLVSTFNPFSVHRAKKTFHRSIPVALLRRPGLLKYTYLLASAQADNPHHDLVDENYMRWARGRGYRTYVWVVDDQAEAARLAALGVHGIITAKPLLLRQHLS